MSTLFRALCLLIVTIHGVHAEDIDGHWQLTIEGVDRLEFGSEFLAGGIRIGWVTELDFVVEQGRFKLGSGSARLVPGVEGHSRPADMFNCHEVDGIFASRSGQSFTTPHLRYQSFPMLGRVEHQQIRLNPRLDYPGNYYAILYECATTSPQGAWWTENAPRIARELGKRQNALVKVRGEDYIASIKEVKTISPGPELVLPLVDGFSFSVTQEYGLRELHYRLARLPSGESQD